MQTEQTEFIAWRMRDGNTMAGRITDRIGNSLYVTRVDGGSCRIDAEETHPATYAEVMAAIDFFRTIGK